MVGVPEDAFVDGFRATKWVALVLMVGMGYLVGGPRLRELSVTRGYNSPLDFFCDRYSYKPLHYLVLFAMLPPTLIYITAQFKALDETVETITDGQVPGMLGATGFAVIILAYESVGGLGTAASIHIFQASLMIFYFLTAAAVLSQKYEGLEGVMSRDCPSLEILPVADGYASCVSWSDEAPAPPTGCDCLTPFFDVEGLYAGCYIGCVGLTKPEHFEIPAGDLQRTDFSLCFMTISYVFNPQVLQRIYAARDVSGLKIAVLGVIGAAFLAELPGVLIGITAAGIIPEEEPAGVFAAMIDVIIDIGPFAYFIGLCGLLAALSAIMSTADSCILGTSNVITVDCVIRFELWPTATPKQLVLLGKCVDVSVTALCLFVASITDSVSELASLQFASSMQMFPILCFGLFTREPKPGMLLFL